MHLLLDLHYYHHAFHLSQEFHYSLGMFLATEKQPRFQSLLEDELELQGERKDTNPEPLALEYFAYLHEHHRLGEILTIGRKSERLLREFLKVSSLIYS